MATLDLQEQEQIDTLKDWWNENGNKVLLVLLIVVGSYLGFQGWKYYQNQQTVAAATLFGEFNKQLVSHDPKRINDAAEAVISKYSSSAYAPRAALLAAQTNIEAKDSARAKTQLRWVIAHASENTLKDVARLKLSSLLLDEKNYSEALTLLDSKHAESYSGLYADMKGDVLSAQDKKEQARAAYQLAFEKTDNQSSYRALIQMKLDAFGGEK